MHTKPINLFVETQHATSLHLPMVLNVREIGILRRSTPQNYSGHEPFISSEPLSGDREIPMMQLEGLFPGPDAPPLMSC